MFLIVVVLICDSVTGTFNEAALARQANGLPAYPAEERPSYRRMLQFGPVQNDAMQTHPMHLALNALNLATTTAASSSGDPVPHALYCDGTPSDPIASVITDPVPEALDDPVPEAKRQCLRALRQAVDEFGMMLEPVPSPIPEAVEPEPVPDDDVFGEKIVTLTVIH